MRHRRLTSFTPRLRRMTAGLLLLAGWSGAGAQAGLPSDWPSRLQDRLAAVSTPGAELGVYVHDLDSGLGVSHRGEERWYLASLVKLPVAIAVLRGVEAGQFTLDTTLRLRADDRVDGAGQTNAQPLAQALTVRFLMEQMMSYSDNTASDMLIDLVGLSTVNATAASLVPDGFGRITTLAEVRRQIYGQLTPKASQLRGADLLRLHAQPTDAARLQMLSQLTGVPVGQFRRSSLEAAYAAYYRSGLNAAPLAAYGRLLAAVAQGQALDASHTAWLLALMERTRTGGRRIKAALPVDARFAHKTGTQRKRTCDAGLVRTSATSASTPAAPAGGVVVVACVRGNAPLAQAEAALREVGLAVCQSGVLSKDSLYAAPCPVLPNLVSPPDAAAAAAGDREPVPRE